MVKKLKDNRVMVMDNYKALERSILSNDIEVCVPPRLYKRYMFDNLRFGPGKIYEDFLIVTDIFLKVKKAVYNGNAKYYYRIRDGKYYPPRKD